MKYYTPDLSLFYSPPFHCHTDFVTEGMIIPASLEHILGLELRGRYSYLKIHSPLSFYTPRSFLYRLLVYLAFCEKKNSRCYKYRLMIYHLYWQPHGFKIYRRKWNTFGYLELYSWLNCKFVIQNPVCIHKLTVYFFFYICKSHFFLKKLQGNTNVEEKEKKKQNFNEISILIFYWIILWKYQLMYFCLEFGHWNVNHFF